MAAQQMVLGWLSKKAVIWLIRKVLEKRLYGLAAQQAVNRLLKTLHKHAVRIAAQTGCQDGCTDGCQIAA